MSSSKPAGEESARALTAAVRYASAGVRSTRDVTIYLRRRGVAAGTINRAIAALRTRGLVDDDACARLWAEQWARRGYAADAIRAKLAAKGLNDVTIYHAFAQLRITADDDTRAREVAARFLRPATGGRKRARLARTLASRGFDSDQIEQVLNESLGPLVSS